MDAGLGDAVHEIASAVLALLLLFLDFAEGFAAGEQGAFLAETLVLSDGVSFGAFEVGVCGDGAGLFFGVFLEEGFGLGDVGA